MEGLLRPVVWNRYVKVNDRPTELFGTDTTGNVQLQVLVIPGNPGNAGYYIPFLRGLAQQLPLCAQVTAISQLGHCSKAEELNVDQFSLRDQIQHKVDYVMQHMLGAGRAPVVLIGHSIGAYIAVHAVQQLQKMAGEGSSTCDQIRKVVCLFPFFTVDPDSPKQRFLRRVSSFPAGPAWVARGLSMLPTWVKRSMIKTFGGMDEDHAVSATLNLVNGCNVRNALYLAHKEFTELQDPVNWELLEELGDRLLLFCAPNGVWCPSWKWDMIKQQLPSVEMYFEERQNHGFCTSERLSEEMAMRIATVLNSKQALVANETDSQPLLPISPSLPSSTLQA